MTRLEIIYSDYQLLHRIKFRSIIRGHHVYKANWTPAMNEILLAKPDNRVEALVNDKFLIGIFKEQENGAINLVVHAPIELSSLLHHFLKKSEGNFIRVTVIGKRKREIGLVVPAKYDCQTNDKRFASVLDGEIQKRKNMYKTLELYHQN